MKIFQIKLDIDKFHDRLSFAKGGNRMNLNSVVVGNKIVWSFNGTVIGTEYFKTEKDALRALEALKNSAYIRCKRRNILIF